MAWQGPPHGLPHSVNQLRLPLGCFHHGVSGNADPGPREKLKTRPDPPQPRCRFAPGMAHPPARPQTPRSGPSQPRSPPPTDA